MEPGIGMWLLKRIVARAPRSFRDRHAVDLLECHRDAWAEEAEGRGVGTAAVFWLRALGSTAWLVVRQWVMSIGREEGARMRETIRPSVTLGIRRILRRPRYASAIVLTLALGIGANAAVFSVLHSVLLAPLPFEDDESLVRIHGARRDQPGVDRLHLPTPAVLDLRDVAGLAGVAALENQSPSGVDITDGPTPERLRLLRISADYFDVLGESLVLGRPFDRLEEGPDSRVAIVSERVWDAYLGRGPSDLGRQLTLDGERITVVGVVADRFRDPLEGDVDVFVPLDLQSSATNWENNWLTVIARRTATTEQLRSELDALEAGRADAGSSIAEKGHAVVDLREEIVGDAGVVLTAIMAAVVLLLLMTAVNVASLMLAEAGSRVRELAVRASIGAGRRRLVYDFLAESLLLSIVGGIAGLVLGWWVLEAILSVAPPELPRLVEVRPGLEVVSLTMVGSVALGIGLGLATALPFSRPHTGALAGSGRAAGGAPKALRLRNLLVKAEVMLAVVLLIGATTLVRSVEALNARDIGVEPDNVLTFRVGLPGSRYGSDVAIYEFSRQLHEVVATIPGVQSAGVTSRLPVTGSFNTWGTKRAHGPDAPFDVPNQAVNQRWIAGDYFATVGLAVTRGRSFDATDEAGAAYSTVVNEAFVRSLYGEEDPIGTWIRLAGRFAMIVGVVEDEALTARSPAEPVAYHHQRQWISGSREMTQVVRIDGEPTDLVPSLRRAVASVDPDLVLFDPIVLDERIGLSVAGERFAALLLSAFALLAMAVAGLGLYALLAHTVRGQRHEIGVRVALGARRGGIVALVLARGMALAGVGLGAGVLVAMLGAGALEPLLYDVRPRDPLALGLSPLLLGGIALVASLIPALRATRIQPVEAFRDG